MKVEKRDLLAHEKEAMKYGFATHTQHAGFPPWQKETVSWVIKDQETLVGTLIADLCWDWMYIDVLFVDERYRGKDQGTLLMTTAEQFAQEQKLVGIYLTTQDWQAPGFYTKLGYEEFGRLPDFPKGSVRYFYKKHLAGKP